MQEHIMQMVSDTIETSAVSWLDRVLMLQADVDRLTQEVAELSARLRWHESHKGYVYLVACQCGDRELIKVGITRNPSGQRLHSYGATRRELRVFEVPLPCMAPMEDDLKLLFKERFTLAQGFEYFECGDEEAVGAIDEYMEGHAHRGHVRIIDTGWAGRKRVLQGRDKFVPEEEPLPPLPKGCEMPAWRADFVPTPENRQQWLEYEGPDADLLQAAFERTLHAVRVLRVVPERVDEQFYSTYVDAKQLRMARWLAHSLRTTSSDNQAMLRERLAARRADIKATDPDLPESKLWHHEWDVKKHFVLPILAQQYLEWVGGEGVYERLRLMQDLEVSRKRGVEWCEGLIASLNDLEKKGLAQLLDASVLPVKQKKNLVKAITKHAFSLQPEAACKTRAVNSKSYDRMRISMEPWRVLVRDYGSELFQGGQQEPVIRV